MTSSSLNLATLQWDVIRKIIRSRVDKDTNNLRVVSLRDIICIFEKNQKNDTSDILVLERSSRWVFHNFTDDRMGLFQ